MRIADEIVAVLDADVLIPMPLCDTLLSLAEEGLFVPCWSRDILEEVRRNLVGADRCTPAQALRRIGLMDNAFPEALTEDYEALVPQLRNDEKDRHVLAAAIRADADLIVTQNVRDFPAEALRPWRIRAVDADRFLSELIETAPGNDDRIARRILRQSASLTRPLMTHRTILERLALHAPSFAERTRAVLERGRFDLTALLSEEQP